jgi:CheY-like chemotaxis protein
MTTWMLVEDEPDLFELLLHMTQIFGVSGVAFTTGEEAIAWIDDIDRMQIRVEMPQLALIDLRMPGDAQGDDVSARIRRSPTLGAIPVVLITAYHLAPAEERRILAKSGAQRIVYKPLPVMSEFQQLIHQTMMG